MRDFSNMTSKDILLSCCGEGPNGEPKTVVSVNNEMWGLDGSIRYVDELGFDNVIVNIYNGGKYYTVDLTFKSSNDPYLEKLVKALEKFTAPENSLGEEVTEFPSTVVCIIPNELEGHYYVLGSHMIYWHQHIDSYSDDARTVRMLFEDEDFIFYRNDELNNSEE